MTKFFRFITAVCVASLFCALKGEASVSRFGGQRCQVQGAGCASHIPCCGGLNCVLASGIWGFCQPGGSGPNAATQPPRSTQPSNPGIQGALITKSEFERAVTEARPEAPYPRPTDEQYRNVVNRAASAGQITTKRELAMFLANILWESDGLRAKEEYSPGSYPYPALDVPGKKYHGRGYIQLTWSYNYRDASMALYGDDRLLRNPEQVATNDAIAWDTAFWFWSSRVHNRPGVSAGHFGQTIQGINSMECNGWNEKPRKRFRMYQNIYRVFGLPGQPIETGCYN